MNNDARRRRIAMSGSIRDWVAAVLVAVGLACPSPGAAETSLTSVPLVEAGYGTGVTFAVDPYDGSAWVATNARLLLHVGVDGGLLAGTTLHEVPDALAVALDQSVWLLAGGSLAHHARDGSWMETRPVPAPPESLATTIAVDSLGDRLWVVSSNAIVPIMLDPGRLPPDRVTLECDTAASALDARNGRLYVSCADRLLALGRDGTQIFDIGLKAFGIKSVESLVFDAASDAIVVVSPEGRWRVSAGGTPEKLDAIDATRLADTPPFSILPMLELIRPPQGGATDDPAAELMFGVGASCAGRTCALPTGYAAGMTLSVELNGARIAIPNVDPVTGRAVVSGAHALQSGLNGVTAHVTDRFGHRADLAGATLTLLARSERSGTPDWSASEPAAEGARERGSDPALIPKAANKAPTVAITSPSAGRSITVGSDLALAASASDADGSVVKVEFYSDSTLLGASTTPPYSIVWRNVTEGRHAITASAYDNRKAKATSAPVAIDVVRNQPPVVTLAFPADDSFHPAGIPIALGATASDPDGAVVQIEFYEGPRLLASMTAAPWLWTWIDAIPGRHTITVRAIDDRGAAASSGIVSIVVGAAPKVVVNLPGVCAKVDGPLDLALGADAASTSGAVASVEFFDGSTLVGTALGSPWRATLVNATVGTHSITARATDDHGLVATSRAALIEVRAANQKPSVSIRTPADGARYAIGSTIDLSATATDPDGSVASVEYRLGFGGNLIGRATTAPYSVAWSGMAAGTYGLVAIAIDDRSASTTSSAITVTVSANAAPNVALTAPAAGATYVTPATIDLVASATDSDGSIAKVEFFAGSTLLGTDTSAPFTANWSQSATGTYAISARATDNLGASTTSAPVLVAVIANAAPTATLTAPAAGTRYFAPATIPLSANASDSDGTVTRVEFYANGERVASTTAAPFAAIWNNVAGGSYTVTAVATDDRDSSTTSSSVAIEVIGAPSINIGPGIANAVINDDRLTMTGWVSAPENSAVTINGIVAHIDDYGHFNANDLPLAPGANTITATVVSIDGQTASQSITLESAGPAPFLVEASPTEGIGTLAVDFSINNPERTPFTQILIDLESDGYPNLIAAPANIDGRTYAFTATYPEGTWTATITALDNTSQPIFSTTRKIVVLSPRLFQSRLRSIYTSMLDRLRAGNLKGALSAFTGSAYAKYDAIFSQLQPILPTVIDQLGTIREISFAMDIAEISLVRQSAEGDRLFPVYLIRSEDGIWRIDGM